MERRIRLTEGDLHKIVEESVKRILKEGQGWNAFKSRAKEIFNGEYDDYNPLDDENYANDRSQFIKYGDSGGDDNYQKYYDEEGRPCASREGNKKINKGFMGRLGRKAAVNGVEALYGLRQGYNKLRGRNQ